MRKKSYQVMISDMITVFGETILELRENEDGVFEKRIVGRGYETALALAKDGDFPLLITGIGQDPVGADIVTDLVEKEIMFDSDMAIMNIESPVRISYLNGRKLEFIRNSSAMCVNGELLNLALSVHTDIKAVMLSNPTLSYNPVSFTYLDGASFLDPYPYICLDAVEDVSTPVWDRMKEQALAISDIVRVDAEGREKIDSYKDILLVTGSDKVDVYRSGSAIGSFETSTDVSIRADFTAHVMKSLEKKGLLENAGKAEIADTDILEAVEYALKVIA